MSTDDLAALQAQDCALSERVSRASVVRSRVDLQHYMSWINISRVSCCRSFNFSLTQQQSRSTTGTLLVCYKIHSAKGPQTFCNSVLQKHGKEQQQAFGPPLDLTADNCYQLQGDI